MNFETARENMVTRQIRAWDVTNPRVLEAMKTIPREEFVQVPQRKLAFADLALPLGHGEFMMKPVVEGRTLQTVNPQSHEDILEVGTGSGYMTALLATLGKQVDSLDIYPDFIEKAQQRLEKQGINNAHLIKADVFTHQPDRRYDLIVLTGSVSGQPDFLLDWLKPDGRIFAIVGHAPIMQAQLIQTKGDSLQMTPAFETYVPPLKEPAKTSDFTI